MRTKVAIRESLTTICRSLLLSLALLTISQADGPKIMQGYVLHGDGGPASAVITTTQELAAFVSSLPEHLPSKKEPAPANPDPLRRGFQPDFSREILVVAIHRDTLSAFPEFGSVREEDGSRVVLFDLPEPPPEARPYGWGVYTLVVLPRVEGATTVRVTPVTSKWSPPSGP